MVIAGIDEAGYGPLLGPLVVGCCAFRVEGNGCDPLADPREWPCLWKRLGRYVSRNRLKLITGIQESCLPVHGQIEKKTCNCASRAKKRAATADRSGSRRGLLRNFRARTKISQRRGRDSNPQPPDRQSGTLTN